jgi:hypothetical protein
MLIQLRLLCTELYLNSLSLGTVYDKKLLYYAGGL